MTPPSDAPPLVEAKLAPPRRLAAMVQRPRVAAALDAGADAALTLVAAPAGYGKTTAVRAWSVARDVALAWVTLDAGDNDPNRLWTYVATAVDRIRAGVGDAALQRLAVAGSPVEIAVDDLMNAVAALRKDVAVVLDDLHLVTDLETLASIDHALEHLPANARVLLLSRSDPAIRLASLRGRGLLAEVRARELAFTAVEAAALLDGAGLTLSPDEVQTLLDRTDGWPAALLLAAIWLRRVDDPHEAVRAFGGDNRFVADYLSHEVLDGLDETLLTFTLQAAVLEEFTPELCDEIFERTDSAALVAELERQHVFVEPLEHGRWFRMHSLFAEFARLQLASVGDGLAADIHRRAALWFRDRGLVVEAAHHAAEAGDGDLQADVVAESHLTLIRTGRARTLLRLARALPDERLADRPALAAAAATAATLVGGLGIERRRLLGLAEGSEEPYARAVSALVRAGTLDGGVQRAVAEGRLAVEIARTASSAEAALVGALASYARALYFEGDLEGASASALEAVEHAQAERRAPGHVLALTTLALACLDRGQATPARRHAERARSIVGRIGSSRSWLGGNVSAALGAILAADGKLTEAERELARAERFFLDDVATVHHAWLLLLLARVRCRRGRLHEAEAALASAREELAGLEDTGWVATLAGEVSAEVAASRLRAEGDGDVTRPSRAEMAVLGLLATELSAREIAGELYLSPNTVHTHLRSIYRKLGVGSRADAVARASALGLLPETGSPG